jgi:anti-sigma-K factor RskA
MTGNEHIDVEDLAMYALALLDAGEAASIRAHLETCADCRAELGQVRADLAMYALTTEPAQLPEGARERFVASLDDKASTGSAPGSGMRVVAGGRVQQPQAAEVQSRRSPVVFTLAWAGWAVAAAVAVVALGLHRERDALRSSLALQTQETARLENSALQLQQIFRGLSAPGAVKVSLTVPKEQPNPSARATYDQHTGTLMLQAGNLTPLAPNKVYELWLIPANGKSPIPAGIFRPDAKGNANLLIAGMRDAVPAKAFGITVEHAGGSPTPTLPIVLAGAPG